MPLMDLSSITVNQPVLPPRLVIYGDHGIGKTTLATQAPRPIVLRTENGLAAIRVPTFPIAKHFGDITAAIETLLQNEHPYQTFIVDTLDWLEPLIWNAVAIEEGRNSIEEIPYGKGYKLADEHWRTFLSGCDALREQKGMTVILLAHVAVKRFNAPETDPYDRYQIKLHDRASQLVQEWADIIGFAHYETTTVAAKVGADQKVTRGISTGTRILSVEERAAYDAKNRYSLPADLPLSWPALVEALAPAFAPIPSAPAESQADPLPETDSTPVLETAAA